MGVGGQEVRGKEGRSSGPRGDCGGSHGRAAGEEETGRSGWSTAGEDGSGEEGGGGGGSGAACRQSWTQIDVKGRKAGTTDRKVLAERLEHRGRPGRLDAPGEGDTARKASCTRQA